MTGILNALIAGVSGAVKDAYFNLVSLLLPGNGTNGKQNNAFLDSSTNNFTITPNGNTTQGTFSPFSQTGWGNYFSGSGQYLSLADNAAYALSNGNFTAEAWVFKPASGRAMIMGQGDGASAANTSFFFQVNASDKLEGIVTISSTDYTVTASATFLLNQWVHVALVRTGPNLALYINGSKDGEITTLSTNSLNDSPSVFSVGAFGSYGSFRWSGYISNARLVKGVAVYTGNFAPPLSPLTATQSAGTNISAITGTQTSLLTCQSNRFIDNSVANSGTGFPITVNGSPSVTPFSPFAPTQSYSAAAVGGSGYFDGTGDYLDGIGTAANWAFMSNSTALWSLECWLFTSSSGAQAIIDTTGSSSGNIGVYVSKTSSNTILVDITRGVAGTRVATGTTTGTLTLNAWNHLLVTYDQSLSTQNLKIYINGGSVETFNKTANAPSGSNPTYSLRVGGYNATTTETWNGYISSLRISNVVRSSSVPTAPYTSDANTQLLLNFTNAGVVDATAKNVLETVGNAQISTTQSKWGGGSIAFDGTDDRLTNNNAANPLYAFRTGDFTIEAWVYPTVNTGERGWIQISDTAGGLKTTFTTGILINYGVTPNAYWSVNVGGTAVTTTTSVQTNTWTHIAVTRTSGSVRVYIGGNLAAGPTSVTADLTGQYLVVGGYYSTAYLFNGYIDDLRITNYSRYSGSSLTVPTAPFPVQ